MSTLRESVKSNYELKKRWLEEAEQALNLVRELPLAIQNLEGSADVNERYTDYPETEKYLSLNFDGGDETVELLKEHGIADLERKFSTYGGNYYYSGGKLPIGIKNIVKVSGDVKPPYDCKVVEYKEEVTRYREECEPLEEATTEVS